MTLKETGNIPYTLSTLRDAFPDHRATATKAKRLEESGHIIRLKRGIYVTAPALSHVRLNEFLIAQHLHGPSYVSLQTALSHYGLIPEGVAETMSVTAGAAKTFKNAVGVFSYFHCNEAYYPIGLRNVTEGDASFIMAGPEKALCDLIIFTRNFSPRYRSELRMWLEEDMRIDLDDLRDLDTQTLRLCAAAGKKSAAINNLISIIENERNI